MQCCCFFLLERGRKNFGVGDRERERKAAVKIKMEIVKREGMKQQDRIYCGGK